MKIRVIEKYGIVIVLALSLIFVLLHLQRLGEDVYWWTPDSASYIEAARNFSMHGKLAISTGVRDLSDTKLVTLWPPGYPIILASLQDILGIDAQWISVFVAIFSWILIPTTTFLLLKPILGPGLSILISVLTLTSPSLVHWGWKGLSDMPFFFITVCGFLMSFSGGESRKSYLKIFCGGLFLGIAFSIRNIGIAALAAVFLSYLAFLAFSEVSNKKMLKKIFFWSTGSASIVAPVLIYNFFNFEKIQPYSMAPSSVGLLTNLRTYIQYSFFDITSVWKISKVLAWDYVGFMSLSIALGAIFLFYYYKNKDIVLEKIYVIRSSFNNGDYESMAFLAIFLYPLFGACIVIYARTKYEWGELINLRHVMQYSWALLSIILFFVYKVFCIKKIKKLFLIVFSFFIVLHLHYFFSSDNTKFSRKIELKLDIYRNSILSAEIKELYKDNFIIFSNYHDVLRISTKTPVRALYLNYDNGLFLKENIIASREVSHKLKRQGKIFLFSQKGNFGNLRQLVDGMDGVDFEQRDSNFALVSVFP